MTGHTTHFEDLAAALRVHAKGLLAAEAAVELLIGQRSWLYRDDFRDIAVEPGREAFSGRETAAVDFEAAVGALEAGALACASSEGRMLRLAASIAAGVPVDLGDAVSGLDEANAGLVAAAVLHAAGHGDLVIRRDAR
ncbi:MAG TPA: hypothetical protein VMK84_06120 [Streptosporangiaceae bacterium]|nr:hypothetical protein [Streptosporangiaceae bacterium]